MIGSSTRQAEADDMSDWSGTLAWDTYWAPSDDSGETDAGFGR